MAESDAGTAASAGTDTRNAFIDRALGRLADACGSTKRHSLLKQGCIECRSLIPELTKQDAPPSRVLSAALTPLKLAAESRVQKMIEIALDCLQRLIAYSFITGGMQYEHPGTWMQPVPAWAALPAQSAKQEQDDRLVIHHAVQIICHNVSPTHSSDPVHLQIIRALISAVSTQEAGVHGSALVAAVRNTYNIYLVSQSVVNQRTAKASLAQMIGIVVSRMEATGPERPRKTASMSGATAVLTPTSLPAEDIPLPPTPVAALRSDDGSVPPSPAPQSPDEWVRGLVWSMVAAASGDGTAAVDPRHASEHLEPAFRQDDDARTDDSSVARQQSSGSLKPSKERFRNQEEHDASLIFRSLCALSVKPVPPDAGPDSLQMKSKLLSLELILTLLACSGEVFRSSPQFIRVVKQNLCLSLLQNCVSPTLPVCRISLSIFLALISNFRDHLKVEIGVFFTNVLLVILESPNSSFQQKTLVLLTIHKVCESAQTIIDVFVNYDCELESVNIFEKMMNNLSKILQMRHQDAVVTPRQEADLKRSALQTLVMVLRSLVHWTDRFLAAADESPARDRARRVSVSRPADADDVGSVDDAPQEDGIEKTRALKLEIAENVACFNKGAKQGLERMWAGGALQKHPRTVAQWLLETPGVSKAQIGEYLSRTKDFEKKVLDEFVELFDFTGLEIDKAVRKFLGKFRICGEAQVIDRTMEKFAEVYCRQNPSSFPNAGTAYVLSFSIIMLNTDSASTQIKEKMKKEEFLRNNRGIDDGKDLSESYLSGIYDRVTARPFALDGEGVTRSMPAVRKDGVLDGLADALVSDGRRRAQNYEHEMRQTVSRTEELFKGGTSRGGRLYLIADRMEHARPMFVAAWAAMLPAFSVLLEQSSEEDSEIVRLCLEGFELAIHVSCVFYLDVERDAFVSALSKMTFLSNYREIEGKNLKSIKLLISIASREGNYLRSSWYAVLRCISQLERLQLLGSGAKPDFAFLNDAVAPKEGGRKGGGGGGGGGALRFFEDARPTPRAARERVTQYEHLNSQMVRAAVDDTQISRIYSSTRHLTGEAVVSFVQHLCEVSNEEIEQSQPPRMFSLQKLIEVADINMDRMRIVWTELWMHMSRHFVRVGTNSSLSVSMFGIDSLRQLAVKFLAKPELTNYHFQRDFLKPFETILQRSQSIEIRELIVRCLAQMVQGRAGHMKSGWKTVFGVLSQAASDPSEQIVALAFDTVDHILGRLLGAVVAADAFVDSVNCLIAFSCNRLSRDIAIRATSHMTQCAECLVTGVVVPHERGCAPEDVALVEEDGEPAGEVRYVVRDMPPGQVIESDDRAQLRVWFPILTGLCADATQHPDVEVRLAALAALFHVLSRHGCRFSFGMWKLVFAGSVLPVLDNAYAELSFYVVNVAQPTQADTDAARRNAKVVEVGLSLLVDLFALYYPVLRHLVSEILAALTNCVSKPAPPRVALIGLAALTDIVCNHSRIPERLGRFAVPYPEGARADRRSRDVFRDEPEAGMVFEDAEWTAVCRSFWHLVELTFPAQLLRCRPKDGTLVVGESAAVPRSQWGPDVARHGAGSKDDRVVLPRRGGGAVQGGAPLHAAQTVSSLAAMSAALRTQYYLIRAVGDLLPLQALLHAAACFDQVQRYCAHCLQDPEAAELIHSSGGELCGAVLGVEVQSLRHYLHTLCRLFRPYGGPCAEAQPECRGSAELTEQVRPMLHALITELLERYGSVCEAEREGSAAAAARAAALTPAAVDAVNCIADMDDAEFADMCGKYYCAVLRLCGVMRPPVASALQRFFSRVGALQLRIAAATVAPSPTAPEVPPEASPY
eukprot:TRINITY_DN1143_c1_g1_i1.p1 TRINITY_DN1143_c1_g1~~TRINITY_DN1143_c1_g1_i1.p1  ORF type:complete len:1814 (+),score=717.82 TRINITY_DN1143_c1_g1_i1:84-5525(+)